MKSTIIPPELISKYDTVSEALLQLNENIVKNLRLNAPLICTPQRAIVPFTFVVTSKDNDLLGVREHILEDLRRSCPDISSKLNSIFPPKGEFGFWDAKERIYRTRYMKKAAFEKPSIPRNIVNRKNIKDLFSFYKAFTNGEVIPFIDTSIIFSKPDLKNKWAFKFKYKDNPIPYTIFIAYRGCSQLYDYPFRASAFRRFQNSKEAKPFEGLKKFVCNLIVEYVWSTFQTTIFPNESESIIQHYKLLPWTYMTDASYDINIAKAFACCSGRETKESTPVLYQVALLNIDYFDLGGCFLDKLPFQRPKAQKAISIIGLNSIMQDLTGVIVSLIEHPFFYNHKGTSWDLFGGEGFSIGEIKFDSLYLNCEEYNHLQSFLYPVEPKEINDIFNFIINKIHEHINFFKFKTEDKNTVLNRLIELKRELNLSQI